MQQHRFGRNVIIRAHRFRAEMAGYRLVRGTLHGAGVMIGIPWNGDMASRSPSPVTRWSARPMRAVSRILSSVGVAAAEPGTGDRHPFRNRGQQRDEGCPGFPAHVAVELRAEDPIAKLGERLVAEEEDPVCPL